MKHIYLTAIVILIFSAFAKAQLTGALTDQNNNPIAFASIYVKGTYTGTTTNADGTYLLQLPEFQTYEIVFQSLGYKTENRTVDYREKNQRLDIQLTEEVAKLDEVVVNSDENPADRVIREAIARRKFNKNKTDRYTAKFYSRGLWSMEDVPEKFLGQEIGDLDGSLDSLTRSGIIYLSETFSEIAYEAPNNFKERITASKISGDDNGFSVNSAEEANFNFYENNIDLNNRIVSPIADYAFNYYRYKLLGTYYDENQFLINKIQVSSKRPKDNTFDGIIYIVEDQWTISGLELTTTGENINVPPIEKLTFNQDFTYDQNTEYWVKRSQSIDFAFKFLGFQGNGRFIANYTDYDFNPQFEKKYFGAEVLRVEADANKKDSLFWVNRRPIPLTEIEQKDYIKKDSISAVRNDPKYKDSVDHVRNRFGKLDLFTGYTYRDSNERSRWSYDGLITPEAFKGFNTVQGFVLGTGLSYSKGFDERYNRYFYAGADFEYGFSDDRLRYTADLNYRFNRTNRRTLSLSGGTRVFQINNSEPISNFENTVSSLFFERNFAKFYEADYIRAGYSEEIANGFYLSGALSYEKRQGLNNTTDQVWFPWDDYEYTSNNPLPLDDNNSAFIEDHEIAKALINLTIRPGQKYQNYPDGKYNIRNEKYPSINVRYEGGFAGSEDGLDFHQLSGSIWQSFDMGNLGRSSYWVNGGTFFNADDVSIVDYQHFNGNQLRIKTAALNPYGFGLLNYYGYSTNESYAQVHLQHDFKGYILGKIPGINQLNYDLILSGKALYTERKPYFEVSAGIDNIGLGKFRPFRIDYVHSITSDRSFGSFILGINVPF
ncbi:hypothetical protein BST97_02995 [Nonlabens spongiae]|uniref:Membrane receptor RagA n=1 Tax=Nonlabens spongiae TaxID=331648 RepID=A0A1W6MHH2_9FLAO|nr:DUF5686 and carboxypeptidase regulatory-like domain-containing protein [Nonlabens spongiae]ARN77051.1 hypothetical protein BST97_02995 [Nonlabens spongiae]